MRVGALKESASNRFRVRHGFELAGQTEFDNHYLLRAAGGGAASPSDSQAKKPMKSFAAVSILALACSGAWCQPSTVEETLEASTRQFAEAMNRREFVLVAARTHPKVAAAVGGEGALAKAIQSSLKDIPFSGMRFQPGRKECAAVSGEILCVVPYEGTIDIGGEPHILESFYLVSTPDLGGRWFFADGNGAGKPGAMKFLFPAYAGEPRLPAKVKPRKAPPVQ